MAENTTDMILTAGLSGRVTFAPRPARAAGLRAGRGVGRSALDLAYPEDRCGCAGSIAT
jgi:hypothetical protein